MTIAEITIDDPTATLDYIHSIATVIGYIIAGIFINLYVKRKQIVEAETRRAEEKRLKETAPQHAHAQQQFQEHRFVNQYGGQQWQPQQRF